MATAPPYHEVTCQQYHRQLLAMARCNKATPTIQEVAAAMGISLVEATQHQSYIDHIIREARAEFEMGLYTNADIPSATIVYHRHLLALARCNKATPTIQEVADAMGISEARATQLQSYLDGIIREARVEHL
jgi:hypothetical protein